MSHRKPVANEIGADVDGVAQLRLQLQYLRVEPNQNAEDVNRQPAEGKEENDRHQHLHNLIRKRND